MRRAVAVLCAGLVSLAGLPAGAYHMGETFRVQLQTATVHGSYSKRACSAQTNLKSARNHKVAFSVYWKPGRALYLLTTHPGYARARGPQEIRFVFPDRQAMRFGMKHKGTLVQANIGFGARAQEFNRMVRANTRMRIDLPGVGDTVQVNLREQGRIVAAMQKCRDFLH